MPAACYVVVEIAVMTFDSVSTCNIVLQASANTLLAHFVSIVFTNILLRTLNKATPDPKTAY